MADGTKLGESEKVIDMTPALFSVSYAGFWGQSSLPLFEFIDKARALGYPAVKFQRGVKRRLASVKFM